MNKPTKSHKLQNNTYEAHLFLQLFQAISIWCHHIGYVFHLQHNTEKMSRANVWNSLHTCHAPDKTCTIRAAPISCREKTHLNDLEKRSERSRATSPPCTWQSRMPHRLRTHLPPLTLFVYVIFLNPPTLQSSAGLGADSQTEMLSDSHGASTVRMRSVRLGLLWVRDGEEEEDGAPLNWSL